LLFFFTTIYEFERQKMATYLLTKQDLQSEHSKLTAAQEKQQVLERKLNMALVHQILPPKVAEAVRKGEQVQPESFDQVTVFFSDVVGFTNICAKVPPIKVVQMLNDLYTVMDFCTSHFPLYKVETIGDAYM
jgi:class 3 adenylate cyclase